MFESIEDLIENSVNLNYVTYPILKEMLNIAKENSPSNTYLIENLSEIVVELENFLTKIEASTNEEGGVSLDDFEDRKFH